MTNWWKESELKEAQAITIHSLEDRNIVNESIRILNDMSDRLMWASKVVFQSSEAAKKVSTALIDHKKLSSYPMIRDMMIQADRVARDSPWRFSNLCLLASEEIDRRILALKKARHEFTFKDQKKKGPSKGWVNQ